MTAEPPSPTPPDGGDPSMEEILASIRRILNDDETAAAPADLPKAQEEDDVLILDQSMLVAEPEPSAAEEPEPAEPEPAAFKPVPALPQAEPVQQENEAATFTSRPDPFELPAPAPDLVAPEAAAAAAYSVGSLVRTLAAGRATQVYAGGPTLEDMVRSELRPLLKAWLDTNLPPMVERLVRVEIERVVGRAVP